MTPADLLTRRLTAQHLAGSKFGSAAEAVRYFGAVQSQDYAGAKWALGQRTGLTSEQIDAAFDAGEIIRTHVLRPTWHFVHPADLAWMLQLSAPRVMSGTASRHRHLGLDKAIVSRSQTILAEALTGGKSLTRAECEALWREDGIKLDVPREIGMPSIHLFMAAEFAGVITSGPMRGKQHTYALMSERVPATPELSREAAVAELVRRFFISHGPASVKDFVWWSGLTGADAKAGLSKVGHDLESFELDEQVYWQASALSSAKPDPVYLLPNYDEYTVAYADRTAFTPADIPVGKLDARGNVLFNNVVVINGIVAGTWRRALKAQSVAVEVTPFFGLSAKQGRDLESVAARYGNFLGLPAAVVIKT